MLSTSSHRLTNYERGFTEYFGASGELAAMDEIPSTGCQKDSFLHNATAGPEHTLHKETLSTNNGYLEAWIASNIVHIAILSEIAKIIVAHLQTSCTQTAR